MPDQVSERDEVTLRLLAIVERSTVAEQRRRALAAHAQQARTDDEHLAEAVRLTLAARRKRANGGHNVIQLRGGRHAQ